MESESLYQDVPPSAPAEQATVVEDFVDIFYAPSKVFERRRDGRFGLALFLLFVLSVAIFFATRAMLQPIYDIMIDQQVAAIQKQQPNLNPEQVAGMRGMMEKTFLFGPLLGVPMIILVVGVVLWLVGKLFDSKQTFGQAMAVSTFANVPRFVLGSIVAAGLAFVVGSEGVTSPFAYTIGPARFAQDASFLVQTILNRFELFTLWATFLLGLGLHITGRVPKAQAFIAAAIVWGLATLMGALQAMRV